MFCSELIVFFSTISIVEKKYVEIATWLILPVAYACLKD